MLAFRYSKENFLAAEMFAQRVRSLPMTTLAHIEVEASSETSNLPIMPQDSTALIS